MHNDRPKLDVPVFACSLLVALLVALPAVTAFGDDATSSGVIQITDTAPAPAPVPVPNSASTPPAHDGPRAIDGGGQPPAPAIAPHAASSCSEAGENCRPKGTSAEGCCESTREDGCDEQCENCRSETPGFVKIGTLAKVRQWVGRHRDDGYGPESKTGSHYSRWWELQKAMFHARTQYNREHFRETLRGCLTDGRSVPCKFGYFIPGGCGGGGCPPFGYYSMVYPLNPHYVDRRDAGIYAAQGYGVPVTVPLAPNVEQAYNYSWGIPSSRLTPISRTVR